MEPLKLAKVGESGANQCADCSTETKSGSEARQLQKQVANCARAQEASQMMTITSRKKPALKLNGFLVILVLVLVLQVGAKSRLSSGDQELARKQTVGAKQQRAQNQNGFQLHQNELLAPLTGGNQDNVATRADQANVAIGGGNSQAVATNNSAALNRQTKLECPVGLLTFELLTGFIYKPSSGSETLSMMPSTLQLTDCLDYCLHNSSCLAINFEMGLCVLLAQSARQNQQNLFTSQFPVFTIYAEKKCLLSEAERSAGLQRRKRCQRAWTFERVAGYEMKTRPRRVLRALASKEHCMDACLLEHDFECRSANWYRQSGDCHLSDQDRHSVSQSEAGDQRLRASQLYGASNSANGQQGAQAPVWPSSLVSKQPLAGSLLLGAASSLLDKSRLEWPGSLARLARASTDLSAKLPLQPLAKSNHDHEDQDEDHEHYPGAYFASGAHEPADMGHLRPASASVDYLENNCVYEPNKLCEFHKIQNRVLKTVDSIYQDVGSLEECKQKCLSAPYRCYSFDYGDTSERVCRTSHLDQASLVSVREPYLEVVGAITYELASCFNVSIQCRANEMVALVSSSKVFKGKIYAKSRPSECVNDVREALQFELSMRYQDDACDVRSSSSEQRGVFSNEIVIQHHDRIVTTQDVGLSVYCHYDLGNRSVTTNQVDLAVEQLGEPLEPGVGSKQQSGGSLSPLTITGLATTVVRSPNVTMRITNMNGQPVSSATVGDRLALMFEIKEKSSPFGIFVREIVAMDGRQLLAAMAGANSSSASSAQQPSKLAPQAYHYAANGNNSLAAQANNLLLNETSLSEALQLSAANSIQFIDSNGCPTDSNLMGPLVKMDPHGHRLLAPFDAFKFPTSDMVFFRAVVSSCVAECKPAVCQSALASDPDLYPSNYASTVGDDTGNGDADLSVEQKSTTNAQTTPEAQSNEAALERRTTVLSTALPTTTSTTTTTTSTTSAPISSAQAASMSNSSATKSATFAPGSPPPEESVEERRSTLVVSQQQQQQHEAQNGARERSSPIMAQFEQLVANGDSMTTVAGFGALSTSSPATSAPLGEPQSDQAQAAGEQANITLSNNHLLGHQLPPRRNQELVMQQQLHQSGSFANVSSLQNGALLDSNSLLSEQQRQSISDLLMGSDGSLRAIFASNSEPNIANHLTSNQLGDEDHSKAIVGSQMRGAMEALNRLIGRLSANSNSSTLRSERNSSNTIDELLSKYVELYQVSGMLQQQQQQAEIGPRAPSSAKIGLKEPILQQPAAAAKRLPQRAVAKPKTSKDKERQQALADLYLGAFQSMGKRRRRRRRQIEQEADLLAKSSYALQLERAATDYGSQPVGRSAVGPETKRPLFTHGVVEMYHANCKQLRDAESLRRAKRQAQVEQSDEELVVQSIKIVDRLQFDAEQQLELVSRPQATGELAADGVRKKLQNASSIQQPPASAINKLEDANKLHSRQRGPILATSSSPIGAMLIFFVAMCFVFVQISLVLICLIDWSQHNKRNKNRQQELCSNATMSNSDCSTLRSLRSHCSSLSSTTLASHSQNCANFTNEGYTLQQSALFAPNLLGHQNKFAADRHAEQQSISIGSPQLRANPMNGSDSAGGRREERALLRLSGPQGNQFQPIWGD